MAIIRYQRELSEYRILNNDETAELAALIAQGSKVALDKLILHNLRLVCHCANQYATANSDLEYGDLVSIGNDGLRIAAMKFDPSKGVKFSTYAAVWIKQRFQLLVQRKHQIYIPPTAKRHINKYKTFVKGFIDSNGREPYESEVMEHMGLKRKYARDLIRYAQIGEIPMDKGVSDSEKNGHTIARFIADENYVFEPTAIYNQEELNLAQLAVIGDCLTDEERKIIKFRFGLFGHEKKTLDQLSVIIGKTRERVRQIETKALKKLKKELASKGVEK